MSLADLYARHADLVERRRAIEMQVGDLRREATVLDRELAQVREQSTAYARIRKAP